MACAILLTTRRQTVADSLTANPHNRIALTPMDMEASNGAAGSIGRFAVVDADPEQRSRFAIYWAICPLALTIFGVCRARRRPLAAMQHRLLALRSSNSTMGSGQDEAVRTRSNKRGIDEPRQNATRFGYWLLGGRTFEVLCMRRWRTWTIFAEARALYPSIARHRV